MEGQAQPALEPLARAYLEKPSPVTERRLQDFARSHAKQEAGMLAYLALGYSAFQSERFSSAAQLLGAARAVPTTVSDYIAYYYGAALQSAGDHARAIEILASFETKYPDSALKNRASYLLATSLLAAGRADESASRLKKKLDSLPRPGADLLLARAYQAQDQPREAARAYSRIYYHYPASAEAEEAARHKREFPKPELEDLRARAEGLRPPPRRAGGRAAERLRREVEEAYREWIAASSGYEKERAQVARAALLYRTGRTGAAQEALKSLAPSDPEAAAQRLHWLGESFRRLGREQDFLAQVRLLGERYPSSAWYEEALFSAGNFSLLREGPASAARYYSTLYEHFPEGKYAARSHWKVAWTRYREASFDEARRLMEQQRRNYSSGPQVPAALYWLGRIAERAIPAAAPSSFGSGSNVPPRGSDASAEAYFRKLLEDFPLTFYAEQARKRVGDAAAPGGSLPSSSLSTDYVPRPPEGLVRRQKLAALKSACLLDLAALELRDAGEQDRAHQRYWLLELARLERDRGRYQAAMEYTRRVFPNYLSYRLDQPGREVWELLFPLPWWKEIRARASALGLDPYLVAGIIRQESAFNAQAVSSAHASGLMQLLPSVGRRMARPSGVRGYRLKTLFDPESNLRMGTLYLKRLLEHFNGRLEEALAAYNAGVDRVEVWRAAAYQEPAEFVESIPFTETREYVEAVVRNAAVYRKLYASP